MNKFITALAIVFLAISYTRAQDTEMTLALKTTFTQFDSTLNVEKMLPLSTQLDLIAEKYSDQWVTHYYAAYAKVMISYMLPEAEMAKKDLLLDQGDEFLANIVNMGIDNDERYIITAMLANARMAVDGQNRYKEYGPIFDENLKKAKELNENNPHIYYNKGVALFYTPKMFGGGPKKALPYLEKAKGLYPKYDKNNIMIPSWGEEKTDYYISECKK